MHKIISVAAIVCAALLTSTVSVNRATANGAVPSCDLTQPTSCSLRDVATNAGVRIGATLEAAEINDASYSATLSEHFNALTPENAMKMYTTEPAPDQWNFGPADAVVNFAEAHNMEVRGHTLAWAQDTYTPAWVKTIPDANQLRSVLYDHIATMMQRYSDRVHRWDVVNEPLQTLGTTESTSVFWTLGSDWIADAFNFAHSVDPNAELWLNEFGSDWVPGKHEALLEIARQLVAAGVPIHGIGIQTHRVPGLDIDEIQLRSQLQDFVDLGLEVAITELDIPVSPTDPTAFTYQANEYAAIVRSCLAIVGCNEVTTWGVTDASTWLDTSSPWPTPTRPLLFDNTFQPKPAFHAVFDEVLLSAHDRIAHPRRTVAVHWNAAESMRLRTIAAHLGITPSKAQGVATFLVAYLTGIAGVGTTPVSLPPAGSSAHYTNTWTESDVFVLDSVGHTFSLNDSDATRFSVYLLDYLLALGGN